MDRTAAVSAVTVKGDNRATQRQGSVLQAVNRVTKVKTVKLVCLWRVVFLSLFILCTFLRWLRFSKLRQIDCGKLRKGLWSRKTLRSGPVTTQTKMFCVVVSKLCLWTSSILHETELCFALWTQRLYFHTLLGSAGLQSSREQRHRDTASTITTADRTQPKHCCPGHEDFRLTASIQKLFQQRLCTQRVENELNPSILIKRTQATMCTFSVRKMPFSKQPTIN